METSEHVAAQSQAANEVDGSVDNKVQAPRISKTRAFGVLVLFFIATFFLTRILSPESFNFSRDWVRVPHSIEFIKGADFYPAAIKNFVPWAVLSPWILAGHFTSCDELGCLFVGVEFAIKIALLFVIYLFFFRYILVDARKVENGRKRKIAVIVALAFIGYGVSVVYSENLRPVYRENDFLSRLSVISSKTPFPEGTLPGSYQYGDSYFDGVYEGFRTMYAYQSKPSIPRLSIRITFDPQPSVSEKTQKRCPGQYRSSSLSFPSAISFNEDYVLTQTSANLWTCMISYQQIERIEEWRNTPGHSDQLTQEDEVNYSSGIMYYSATRFGFLDSEQTVFVEVSPYFGATNQGGFTSEAEALDALRPFFEFYE